RAAGPLALMVVCGGVLYPWLFLLALSRTSATNTALLIALNPVLTLLFSPLVGERLDRRRLAGVLVALVGAATVITRGDPAHLATLSLGSGDLVALAAAATWATFNLTSRHVVGHLTPAFTNCVIYALGAVALYVLGSGDRPWAQLAAATPTAVAGVVVMAVLSSVIAGQFFPRSSRRRSSASASSRRKRWAAPPCWRGCTGRRAPSAERASIHRWLKPREVGHARSPLTCDRRALAAIA
ncbi:MAG: DMT family transporter, partial [Deltaproteobacteria bacterium]